MSLYCVCMDCGREFRSEKDEKQCQYCWEKDAAIYANDPTYHFPRSWKPNRDVELPAQPAPLPAEIVPEDMPRVKRHGGPCAVDNRHGGPFVSRIGRKTLCQECARTADRIALGVERRSA